MKIINLEKKKMIPLTNKNYEPYLHQTNCLICKKEECEHKYTNDKNYRKFTHHRYYTSKSRGAAYTICNLKFIRPKEIPVIFHKGLNYDRKRQKKIFIYLYLYIKNYQKKLLIKLLTDINLLSFYCKRPIKKV